MRGLASESGAYLAEVFPAHFREGSPLNGWQRWMWILAKGFMGRGFCSRLKWVYNASE